MKTRTASHPHTMKTRTVRKLSLSLLLLSLLPAGAAAQQEDAAATRNRIPFVRQHEVRLAVGAYPLMPNMDIGGWGCTKYYDIDPSFRRQTHRGRVLTSGVWTLAYAYRFTRWFDLGLSLGHYGEYSSSYSNEDGSLVGRNRIHAISVMPVARFTWLNRRLVRMYSSVGCGAVIGWGRRNHDFSAIDERALALQFTPVGIAVGRSLFGFAEAGLGTQGSLTVGIGYRFNPKNNAAK